MKLLERIDAGRVSLKNRIMFPPLTTGYEARDGSITPQSTAFYERLAKGGAAYIVIGDVAPIPTFSPVPKLCADSQIESYRQLADAVHKYGAKISVQIFHPEYDTEGVTELFRKGDFDGLRAKMKYDMMHYIDEVSQETLQGIIEKMCQCAVRAKEAGIDGIQVHGDRLVGALSSTILNHRTDCYGGSLENRTRFAIELVTALRKAVPDMMIDYKLAVVTPNRGKGGVNAEEAVIFAKWLEEAGVDMLHVAQANHTGNMADTIPPMGVQPYAFFADIAAKVKEQVQIPVSTVGRIVNPQMAEAILEQGKADIIGLGRPLLADPDWVKKLEEGRGDEIRQCIMCNKGCTDNIQNRKFLSCVLNAENGYELERSITPAEKKKTVVVAGGGPAGLESARVAALKGHKVILIEEKTNLGGQLQIAKIPPRKEEMERAITYLTEAAVRSGAEIQCGKKATEDDIITMKPDVVIVAAGAENMMLPIPGADRSSVYSAWKVLEGKAPVYGRAVVIGGGMVGCETAEYLAERGCQVSIVEMTEKIAAGESSTVLPTLMESFKKHQVACLTSHKVESIGEKAVICQKADGETAEISYDFVIMAAGARPAAFSTEKLEAAGIQVIFVGDCKEQARDIDFAIKSAYDAANGI